MKQPKTFKFKAQKQHRNPSKDKSGLPESMPAETEPPIGMVQGVMPMSKEEWRTALALDSMSIQYEFQVSLFGGLGRVGGTVVDFIVHTAPLRTPLYVNGAYWHQKDTFKQQLQIAKIKKLGYYRTPVVVWDYEIPTMTQAVKTLRERLLL